jgi:alpha-galactosidase
VRLPGLDPAASYRVAPLPPGDRLRGPAVSGLEWWDGGVTLPGRALGAAGVRAPIQHPERLVLIEATRVA